MRRGDAQRQRPQRIGHIAVAGRRRGGVGKVGERGGGDGERLVATNIAKQQRRINADGKSKSGQVGVVILRLNKHGVRAGDGQRAVGDQSRHAVIGAGVGVDQTIIQQVGFGARRVS